MNSRLAQEKAIHDLSRVLERHAGHARPALRLSASMHLSTNVTDAQMLPYADNSDSSDLVTTDGNFLFMFGFSAIDGPDVVS